MVYVPQPDLVNPAVVHPTTITSSIAPTGTQAHSSTAATATKTTSAARPSLGHSTCDTGCKATLGVIIPLVLLSVVAMIVYLAWGKAFLQQRKEKKVKAVEDGIAMRKLGDGGSVSEWGDAEIGGGRGKSAKKSAMVKWWKK